MIGANTLIVHSRPDSVHGIIPSALTQLGHASEFGSDGGYGSTTIVEILPERKQMMVREGM